ncbi:MAG TPA: DUF4350 domain-containing protein [Polyangiaceae bacterium]|nr:DUF4350 domain-containing protein [Polyangiaceae bacterium]
MSDVDQVALDQSLKEAFAQGELPFCHDPSYRLKSSDRWLCSLSQAELQRCPAFKQECSVAAKPDAEAERRRHESKPSNDGKTLEVPAWLGTVAELAFWAMVAALVVGVIVSIARMRRSRQETPDESEGPSSLAPPPPDDAATALPSGDRDVARLLDKARRAAERGELGAAIDAAHAAAVQGLSATGHVELDRDRTNGDYLRDLRKVPPLQQEFKVIVGQVEAAQFGGATPTRGTFDRVLEQVLTLLRRLAVLSLCVMAAASLWGCGAHPPSEAEELSPYGLYTLKRLLTAQGGKVHTRVAPLTKVDPGIGVVLVLGAELQEAERKRLLEWVDDGGALVVVASADFMGAGEVELGASGCGHHAERGPGSELAPLKLTVLGERSLRSTAQPESVVSQRVEATCGGSPYVVTSFMGDGSVTFIPERALLSNASLSVDDNARLVTELLSAPGRTIELVGPWTGDGSQSPIESLKSAGMLPVMLQLLGLALLLAVRQGTSFGARRDEHQRERRAFSDHIRALASNYARAGAGALVSGHYGLLLMDQLRDRLCPGQAPSLLQLAAVVARRVQRPETEIVRLFVEAKTSFDEQSDAHANEKLIRELEQLSLQAGGIS